jgi:hypothetical protein
VVANLEFASLFPRLCVEVIAGGTSDHAPLFCSLQVGNEWGGKFSDLSLGGRKNMGLLRRSNRFGK